MFSHPCYFPDSRGGDGDTTPEYQPPKMPDIDVKPALSQDLYTTTRGAGQEFASTQDYLATSNPQHWDYNQQAANPYLAQQIPHSYGQDLGIPKEFHESKDVTEDMDQLKDREELGHYDNGMVSHSGPMRGYPSRADAFVWRPY